MKIIDLIKKDTIILELKSSCKNEIINELVEKLDGADKLKDKDEYKKAILKREEESSTGIGEGIAIPHAKTQSVKTPAIAFGRSLKGIDYDSIDCEPAYLFFMIAASKNADDQHLETLSRLSTLLMDLDFRKGILNTNSKDEILKLIDEKEKQIFSDNQTEDNEVEEEEKRILAVTGCPTGIAHTYMAAEALNKKAEDMNIHIKVETNGSTGVKNKLTEEEIKNADAIIVASDTKVEMDRFNGKILIKVPVAAAIKRPEELIKQALNEEGKVYKVEEDIEKNIEKNIDEDNEMGIYSYLMNGVSNMLPLVVGGGILIALAFFFDFKNIGNSNYGSGTVFAKFLKNLGGVAFSFMFPVLSGFIAFAIADRPALAIGVIGGALAASGGSGFLGALVAGFVAGYIIIILKKIFKVIPENLQGIKPVLLYPVFGILFIGIIMQFIVNPPVAALNNTINGLLSSLSGTNRIVLGLILGGMMAVDMGGPINKVAYVFGVASITEGNGHIMAAVMAGGMVPPLGIALATTLFKNKFTKYEREAGKTNYIMGLSFITEGAIPFAASDPKKVLPSIITGSALAGALSMLFNASSPAPHGGIFVFPLIKNWWLYLISILVGSIVTAILLNILKKPIE